MKKIICLLALAMLMSLVACGKAVVDSQNEETQPAVTENVSEQTESADEQQKDAEEAKKAEEEKKAEEAKKAEEEKKAEETKKTEEEAIRNGIDDEVDISQINIFEEEKTMYVQKSVNVRTGPDKKYDRITSLKVNDPVQVLGQYGEKGWYMVKLNDRNAFISNNFLGDKEVDLEALKAQQEAAATAQAQQNAQVQPAPATTAQPAPAPVAAMPPAGILFIGDSRCVQMQEAVGGGNSSWVCEGGKGYDWFSTTGLSKADPCIGKGTKVVICLGVNDTGNGSKYAALINAKAAEWAARGAKTYFVSVNPVWENPWVTEDEVVNFNNYMIGQLSGVRWIDTHSFLVNNGYYLVDGLHYDTNTYINIFNAIVGSLR